MKYKIFDLNNPNIKITNEPELEWFKDIPVILSNQGTDKIIGVIDCDTITKSANEYFAELKLLEDVGNIEFFNYEVSISDLDVENNSCIISKINSVMYRPIYEYGIEIDPKSIKFEV